MSELRFRISAAAQELFLREGIEGFSMRKVADMAGISAPAIYRHFENKDDLLKEIVHQGLKTLESYLEPALEAPTPVERLARLTERFLDFAIEQPRYFDFAFMIPSRSIESLSDELSRRNWVTFQMAVKQVGECIQHGVFRAHDPVEITIMLWAQAHGLITLYKMHRFGPDPERFRVIYSRSIGRMLDGLKPQAG